MAEGKKSSARRIRAEERAILALEIRKSGASYRDIANTLRNSDDFDLGLKSYSHTTAFSDVKKALSQLHEKTMEKAEELRTLQMERYNDMLEGIWQRAIAGDVGSINAATKVLDKMNALHGLELQNIDLTSKGERVGSLVVTEIIKEHPAESLQERADEAAKTPEPEKQVEQETEQETLEDPVVKARRLLAQMKAAKE